MAIWIEVAQDVEMHFLHIWCKLNMLRKPLIKYNAN